MGILLGVATLAVAAAGVVGSSSSSAATSSTQYDVIRIAAPHPQVSGRWGERLAAAGDMNGDGVNDFFVVSLRENIAGVADAGRVYLLSGKDRNILLEIESPEVQKGALFGFFISVPGDLNGDGRNDVVIGTDAQDVYTGSGTPCGQPEPNGCNEDQGKAWAFNGATGGVLYALNNPDPQGRGGGGSFRARFGSRIGRAGDVTGDGVPDVIVGASHNDVPRGCGELAVTPSPCRRDQGQAYIFNGATGALVRTLNLPDADRPAVDCASNCGTFGVSVQSPGDTNGDGVDDQLVDAGSYSYDTTGTGTACQSPPVEPNGCNESQGRMYVFSGADGSLLLRVDDPEPQAGATFGFQDAAPSSPGDVNGDGFADLYGNGFTQDDPDSGADGKSEGLAWIFNGRTGAVIHRLKDPTPERGGQFAFSLAKTDFNKDGRPDSFVGQSPHHEPGASGSGGTYIFDGASGSLLRAFELPAEDAQPSTPTNLGPNLGWSDAAPGDLNGDGEPDYLAGAPWTDVNGQQDQGRLYLFLSRAPASATNPTTTTTPTTTPSTQLVVKPRVKPLRLTARVTPRRDRRLPYRYTVRGRLVLPSGTSRSTGCDGGRIVVQTKAGRNTISTRRTTLRRDCTYKRSLSFSVRKRITTTRLRVIVRFGGNKAVTPARARMLGVRAG